MEYRRRYESPLGGILLTGDGEALTGLSFVLLDGDSQAAGQRADNTACAVLDATEAWLDTYFAGQMPDFTPPLRLTGTIFQRTVWDLLLQIPYGTVTTYGELAHRMAARNGIDRMSAQAVGGAVGRNPVSIIVPCHRVVGADGSLTGYAGGLERKARLLELEGVDIPPKKFYLCG